MIIVRAKVLVPKVLRAEEALVSVSIQALNSVMVNVDPLMIVYVRLQITSVMIKIVPVRGRADRARSVNPVVKMRAVMPPASVILSLIKRIKRIVDAKGHVLKVLPVLRVSAYVLKSVSLIAITVHVGGHVTRDLNVVLAVVNVLQNACLIVKIASVKALVSRERLVKEVNVSRVNLNAI